MNEADKQTESMHGWRFDIPLNNFVMRIALDRNATPIKVFEYMQERCRRSEVLADSQALEIERLKRELSLPWEMKS